MIAQIILLLSGTLVLILIITFSVNSTSTLKMREIENVREIEIKNDSEIENVRKIEAVATTPELTEFFFPDQIIMSYENNNIKEIYDFTKRNLDLTTISLNDPLQKLLNLLGIED